MSKLSTMAESLVGSEIVRLGNEINDRIRQGEHIYNFTIGDFDPNIFPIPKQLEELIIEAYRQHHTNYPPGDGLLELRQAVAHFLKEWEGLDYAPNEILVASGGRPLIYTIFKTIVDKGDKVIYAAPSWNNNHYVHLHEGVHCVIEATVENNFMPTAADIEPHIQGASLICLCTPQNPTGTTLNKQELEKICTLVLNENARRAEGEKKLYMMFDQMYWTLTYGDTVHYNPVSLQPAIRPYVVFVDGISKSLASTGLRVGWAFGPAFIIAKMKALLSHLGAWAPMSEQKATAKFLWDKPAVEQYFVTFKAGLEERLRKIYTGFLALKAKGYSVDAVAPQAAIYLTIKLELAGKTTAAGEILANQAAVTAYILSEAKLAVVPFYAFGAQQNSPWYRLSVGTVKLNELEGMFAQLELALQNLQ
jgi:aspartate aminotransferase